MSDVDVKPKRERTLEGKISPRVRVMISKEIIQGAMLRQSHHCMIAEAIREAYPRFTNVSVALDSIRLTDPDRNLRFMYLTPRVGQIALIRFDRGDTDIQPFVLDAGRAVKVTRGKVSSSSGRRGIKNGEGAGLHGTRTAEQVADAKASVKRRAALRDAATVAARRVIQADILEALGDPDRRLGVSTPVSARDDDYGIVVGGKMPPENNLAKTRRFGLRSFVE